MSTEGGESDVVFNSPASRWVGAGGKSACAFTGMGRVWNLMLFKGQLYGQRTRHK